MKIRALLIISILLQTVLAPSSAVQAAVVEGLYQAEVPVSSREDERERERAFQVAMRKVLVKLSGREDTLDNPVVAQAISNASRFVEARAYRTRQENDAAAIALEVFFFSSEIQNLLDEAGIPIWPANRADTLLWLVEQDATGNRLLSGTSGSDPAILESIRAVAADKGIPLILPILDIEDQLTMRPDLLWNFDEETILRASERYQAESILAVRVYRAFGGEVIARAVHLFRGQTQEETGFQIGLEDFVDASLSMLSRELAANYAVLLSGGNESTRVALVVEGIKGIADYAGLLQYLNNLAVVSSVQVREVHGDMLVLDINAGGQLRQLIEIVALERKLLPLAEPERQGQQVNLRYQWQSS